MENDFESDSLASWTGEVFYTEEEATGSRPNSGINLGEYRAEVKFARKHTELLFCLMATSSVLDASREIDYRLSPEKHEEILSSIRANLTPALRPTPAHVESVFLMRPDKPAVISHWGVLVGGTLFHLFVSRRVLPQKFDFTYSRKPERYNLSINAQLKFLYFLAISEEYMKGTVHGATRYTVEQIHFIGRALVGNFGMLMCALSFATENSSGTYQLLLNNCQDFANLLMRLICEGQNPEPIVTPRKLLCKYVFHDIRTF